MMIMRIKIKWEKRIKREKHSANHVVLERKNYMMQMSKTKYKKQNKKINNKTKVVVGVYLSRKKGWVI